MTSYTQTALDYLIKVFLEKFNNYDKVITRLTQSKTEVDKDISDLNYDAKKFNRPNDIDTFKAIKQLFFTTCVSLRNPLLKKINFDYVVVDKASQILEPILLESLFFSSRFIHI